MPESQQEQIVQKCTALMHELKLDRDTYRDHVLKDPFNFKPHTPRYDAKLERLRKDYGLANNKYARVINMTYGPSLLVALASMGSDMRHSHLLRHTTLSAWSEKSLGVSPSSHDHNLIPRRRR